MKVHRHPAPLVAAAAFFGFTLGAGTASVVGDADAMLVIITSIFSIALAGRLIFRT